MARPAATSVTWRTWCRPTCWRRRRRMQVRLNNWIAALLAGEAVYINGDGETSRDFCYVANVVQANLLAATTANAAALNQVYNIALGERTTLNELFAMLQDALGAKGEAHGKKLI